MKTPTTPIKTIHDVTAQDIPYVAYQTAAMPRGDGSFANAARNAAIYLSPEMGTVRVMAYDPRGCLVEVGYVGFDCDA